MRSSRSLFWTLTLCLSLAAMACGDAEPVVNEDEELKIFASSAEGKSLVQACQEIEELCQATGKGCLAWKMFCQKDQPTQPPAGDPGKPPAPPPVPTQSDICSMLEKGCAMVPMACELFKQKCSTVTPPAPPTGGFDKGACCAAVKACLDKKDLQCIEGRQACALAGFNLPEIPAASDGSWLGLSELWIKVCGSSTTPQPPPPSEPQPLPGFDKATCCAAVKACVDKNDLQCLVGIKSCGLENIQLPDGMPVPGEVPVALLDLWKKVCAP